MGNLFGVYEDNEFTDIGLGISPALCGKGLGTDFLSYGMDFARKNLSANRFRLTVASFNVRAGKVYERLGFRKINSFVRESDKGNIEFLVMTLD
ncbi:MAG: acetyltransferase [Anaerocolumna sp.]|nr:acetyltransferase [Anaerocolumna sp.]